MRLSRRDLLLAGGISAAGLATPALAADKNRPKAKRGTVIGPGFYLDADTGAKSFVLAMVDLDAKTLARREISLGFFAHGVTPNPRRAERAVLFEKKGPGACEVDLRSGEVSRTITTTSDRRFYGHGAYAADGSVVFAVESMVTEAFKGVITIRDGRTFEVRGLFPTYGAAPHDCHLIDGGKVLVITNGGGDLAGGTAPCVTWVDVATQRLLDKVELSTPRLNTGHLAIGAGGDLAVVSAPRDGIPSPERELGGVSLRAKGGRMATMTEPAELTRRMVGETLSVALWEPGRVVAATTPLGHVVTFWSLDEGRLIKWLDYPHPRGVALTLDRRAFVISYAPESLLVLVDAERLEPIEGTRFGPTHMSGSHVITYDLPA